MSDPTQALWERFEQSRSAADREALVRQYLPLVRRVVDRLHLTVWGALSQDDLFNHAVLGLITAVDRYSRGAGVPFESFAAQRVRGAVLDALRTLDWAPRTVRQTEGQLRRALSELEAQLGRPPSEVEIAAHLGVDREVLAQMLSDLSRASVSSLDELVSNHLDAPSRWEVVEDENVPDPLREAQRGEAHRRLGEAVEALPERERLVVSLYYYEELTLREIGQVLGVTEQRVSQIHARAMLRMQHRLCRHEDLLAAA